MALNAATPRTISPMVPSALTGFRPRARSTTANSTSAPVTPTASTGSQAAAVTSPVRAPLASSRPDTGRSSRNATMPNTHSAIAKKNGARPRPYTPAGCALLVVTLTGAARTRAAFSLIAGSWPLALDSPPASWVAPVRSLAFPASSSLTPCTADDVLACTVRKPEATLAAPESSWYSWLAADRSWDCTAGTFAETVCTAALTEITAPLTRWAS
jgi:hypothetical protein